MKLESVLFGSDAAVMTNSMRFAMAMALALILVAITAVAVGNKYHSPADTTALPSSAKAAAETPVRATKSDRLHVRHEIRGIAGVTVALRDFGQIVR